MRTASESCIRRGTLYSDEREIRLCKHGTASPRPPARRHPHPPLVPFAQRSLRFRLLWGHPHPPSTAFRPRPAHRFMVGGGSRRGCLRRVRRLGHPALEILQARESSNSPSAWPGHWDSASHRRGAARGGTKGGDHCEGCTCSPSSSLQSYRRKHNMNGSSSMLVLRSRDAAHVVLPNPTPNLSHFGVKQAVGVIHKARCCIQAMSAEAIQAWHILPGVLARCITTSYSNNVTVQGLSEVTCFGKCVMCAAIITIRKSRFDVKPATHCKENNEA